MHIYLLSELGLNPGRRNQSSHKVLGYITFPLRVCQNSIPLFVRREMLYPFNETIMKIRQEKYIQCIANAQKYLFSWLL